MKTGRDAAIFAAAAGISAVVTAGFSWLELLLGWLITVLLRALLPGNGEPGGKGAGVLRLIGGIVLAAAALLAAEQAFPQESTFPFVSLCLTALLWRGLIGRKGTGSAVGACLALLLLPLLAAVLLFGIGEIDWKETLPEGISWQRVYLTAAVASPWWWAREQKGGWGWFTACGILSIGMGVMTRGTLGGALADQVSAPLYRAVQTIHVFGTLQRLEALLAAAVLMGAFGMVLLAGEQIAAGAEILWGKRKNSWPLGLAAAASFCAELGYRMGNEQFQFVTGTVFWGLLPLWALSVVLCRKTSKKA